MRRFSLNPYLHIALVTLFLAGCTETGLEPPVVETIPAPVYAALSVGPTHACALDVEGRAFCWGTNARGELGDGSTQNRDQPELVGGSHRFVEIDAGYGRTCAITTDGDLWCWGWHDGAGRTLPVPVEVDASGWRSVSVASYDATVGTFWGATMCAIDSVERAFCEGEQGFTEVAPGLQWSSLSVSELHACGVTPTGAGFCWGRNQTRQLGLNEPRWGQFTDAVPAPSPTSGVWSELVAGNGYTCGTSTTGVTSCWGVGELMALGTDTLSEWEEWLGVAEPVRLLNGALAVADLVPGSFRSWSSQHATCGFAVFGDRRAAICWGDGQGVTHVAFGRIEWRHIGLGEGEACGLTSDGEILCWAPIPFSDAPYYRIRQTIVQSDPDLHELTAPTREWRDS